MQPTATVADSTAETIEATDRGSIRVRGFWGLFDQAVVSGGNFLTNILLANTFATSEEYGRFTLLWGILLLLNSLHGALVTYPLSVRGGAGGAAVVRRMAGGGLAMTLGLSVLTLTSSAAAAGALGVPDVMFWMALTGVAWQLQETTRRAMLAAFRVRGVIVGDAVSYLGQAIGVAILARWGTTHLVPVFALMAATSLAGALVQAVQLQVKWPPRGELLQQTRYSWDVGRWVLLSSLVGVINLQAIPWLVAAFHGPGDAAMLAAVANVLGLTNPIVLGLTGVITPSVARARAEGGMKSGVLTGVRYALVGAALLLPIWLTIAAAPGWVLSIFYPLHDSPYRALTPQLRLMLLIYVIHFAGAMLGVTLGGLEKSGWAFAASLAAVLGTVAATFPLAAAYSYTGALWGSTISESCRLIASAAVVAYLSRAESTPSAHVRALC